jgi:hypothetical protein
MMTAAASTPATTDRAAMRPATPDVKPARRHGFCTPTGYAAVGKVLPAPRISSPNVSSEAVFCRSNQQVASMK